MIWITANAFATLPAGMESSGGVTCTLPRLMKAAAGEMRMAKSMISTSALVPDIFMGVVLSLMKDKDLPALRF
jgi:hypothetical protein